MKALPLTTAAGETVAPTLELDEIATNDNECGHTFFDGIYAYTKTWEPVGPVRARVVFVHGFCDHCNNYDVLFNALASYGIEVRAFDKRGWGRTPTEPLERGDIGTTAGIMSDIESFVTAVLKANESSTPSVPVFLFGHSMGGGEVLTFAVDGPASVRDRIRGFGVEAPLIALPPETRPSKLIVWAGRAAKMVLPKMKKYNKLEAKWVSRDEDERNKFLTDPMSYTDVTLEGLGGMLDRTEALASGKVVMDESRDGTGRKEKVALFVAHGSGDRVTCPLASKAWFDAAKVEDKTWKEYPDWYHRLHAEPGELKLEFARDVATWILDRSGPAVPSRL